MRAAAAALAKTRIERATFASPVGSPVSNGVGGLGGAKAARPRSGRLKRFWRAPPRPFTKAGEERPSALGGALAFPYLRSGRAGPYSRPSICSPIKRSTSLRFHPAENGSAVARIAALIVKGGAASFPSGLAGPKVAAMPKRVILLARAFITFGGPHWRLNGLCVCRGSSFTPTRGCLRAGPRARRFLLRAWSTASIRVIFSSNGAATVFRASLRRRGRATSWRA